MVCLMGLGKLAGLITRTAAGLKDKCRVHFLRQVCTDKLVADWCPDGPCDLAGFYLRVMLRTF
ncbi:hypothetical protein BVH06_04725 [Pseudomonas sp. PA27(2017)]|nr:hypothetical protein BVH06_04725 [Pseudomonas sp. PA27(2017)]